MGYEVNWFKTSLGIAVVAPPCGGGEARGAVPTCVGDGADSTVPPCGGGGSIPPRGEYVVAGTTEGENSATIVVLARSVFGCCVPPCGGGGNVGTVGGAAATATEAKVVVVNCVAAAEIAPDDVCAPTVDPLLVDSGPRNPRSNITRRKVLPCSVRDAANHG